MVGAYNELGCYGSNTEIPKRWKSLTITGGEAEMCASAVTAIYASINPSVGRTDLSPPRHDDRTPS
jgi:hypothetical protein